MSCLQCRAEVIGPIRYRPFTLAKAGEIVAGHAHNFDHVTHIYRGSVRCRVTINGVQKTRDFTPPGDGRPVKIFIAAGLEHEFEALTDDVCGECVYTHRAPEDGEIVQVWNGWEEAST